MAGIVIDGSNVAAWMNPRNPTLLPVLALIRNLRERDIEHFCFFDASLFGSLSLADRQALNLLTREFYESFKQAPSRNEADAFILELADIENWSVLSNDNFRDRQNLYDWIRNGDATGRLIKGVCARNRLMVKPLGISDVVRDNELDLFVEQSKSPDKAAERRLQNNELKPHEQEAERQRRDVNRQRREQQAAELRSQDEERERNQQEAFERQRQEVERRRLEQQATELRTRDEERKRSEQEAAERHRQEVERKHLERQAAERRSQDEERKRNEQEAADRQRQAIKQQNLEREAAERRSQDEKRKRNEQEAVERRELPVERRLREPEDHERDWPYIFFPDNKIAIRNQPDLSSPPAFYWPKGSPKFVRHYDRTWLGTDTGGYIHKPSSGGRISPRNARLRKQQEVKESVMFWVSMILLLIVLTLVAGFVLSKLLP